MPKVSIIVPCLNEERTIGKLLEAIKRQDFGVQDLEVVIADGLSTDKTRQVITSFSESNHELFVKVIDNPSRKIPAGLNLAIAAASGDIVVRLDAHCEPRPDYVSRSLAALDDGLGQNVGGVWEIAPGAAGWMAASIAAAASHPLGVGDALYRFAATARHVDTVPFGCFKKSLVDVIGPFDESLEANEDYEFNARIRKTGGKIWLDPQIRSVYFARPTLQTLSKQYWRYGFWKFRMLRRYPDTLKARQALPPLFVASLIGFSLLALLIPTLRWVIFIEVVSYLSILLAASVRPALEHKRMLLIFGFPLAIATMHLSWGGGFLFSALGPRSWRAVGNPNG
jgi:glycosyltransferase involved in cell wall biosynthesis